MLSPVTFSTACRKGLLTATISNRQRTIRWSASPTTQRDTSSIAGPTTTAAWPSHSTVSYLLISMCQQPKNRVLANLLSLLMASRRLPLRLPWSEDCRSILEKLTVALRQQEVHTLLLREAYELFWSSGSHEK